MKNFRTFIFLVSSIFFASKSFPVSSPQEENISLNEKIVLLEQELTLLKTTNSRGPKHLKRWATTVMLALGVKVSVKELIYFMHAIPTRDGINYFNLLWYRLTGNSPFITSNNFSNGGYYSYQSRHENIKNMMSLDADNSIQWAFCILLTVAYLSWKYIPEWYVEDRESITRNSKKVSKGLEEART
jgi:hypothetical protein